MIFIHFFSSFFLLFFWGGGGRGGGKWIGGSSVVEQQFHVADMRCVKATVTHSESLRKQRIALYSCHCEALRTDLEMRPSTKTKTKCIL